MNLPGMGEKKKCPGQIEGRWEWNLRYQAVGRWKERVLKEMFGNEEFSGSGGNDARKTPRNLHG